MKKQYDFSKGERGKFFRPNARLNLPVYLDAEVLAFVQRIAKRRKTDLSSVVNQLLRGDMELAKSIQ
jgi:cytidylate kinase